MQLVLKEKEESMYHKSLDIKCRVVTIHQQKVVLRNDVENCFRNGLGIGLVMLQRMLQGMLQGIVWRMGSWNVSGIGSGNGLETVWKTI